MFEIKFVKTNENIFGNIKVLTKYYVWHIIIFMIACLRLPRDVEILISTV